MTVEMYDGLAAAERRTLTGRLVPARLVKSGVGGILATMGPCQP